MVIPCNIRCDVGVALEVEETMVMWCACDKEEARGDDRMLLATCTS